MTVFKLSARRRIVGVLTLAATLAWPLATMPGPAQAQNVFDFFGLQHGSGRGAPAPRAREPATTPEQRMAVQRVLASLRFYQGSIDGEFSGRTRGAIMSFQEDIGEAATGRLTPRQLQMLLKRAESLPGGEALAQGGGGGLPALDGPGSPPRGEPYREPPPLDLSGLANGPRQAPAPGGAVPASGQAVVQDRDAGFLTAQQKLQFNREILRRIVGGAPDILDDTNAMASFLRNSADMRYAAWPDPVLADLGKKLREGNEFEQNRVLAAAKVFLRERATKDPLDVVMIRRGTLRAYDGSKQAFPIDPSLERVQQLTLNPGALSSLRAEFEAPLDAVSVPVPPEQAEALLQRFGSSRLVDVVVEYRLQDFTSEDRYSTRATAVPKKISVRQAPAAPDAKLGPVIFEKVIQAPDQPALPAEATPVAKAIDSWRNMGAVVQNDSVLLRSWTEDKRALDRSLVALTLARGGNAVETVWNITALSSAIMSRDQLNGMIGFDFRNAKAVGAANRDEFAKRDVVQRFKKAYWPQLQRISPQLPVNMRFVHLVGLGKYDFNGRAFPITGTSSGGYGADNRGNRIVLSLDGLRTPVITDLTQLPRSIALTENDARGLSSRIRPTESGGYSVYLAYDLELTDIVDPYPNSSGSGTEDRFPDVRYSFRPTAQRSLVASIKKLAFYEDSGLTRLIQEVSLDDLVTREKQDALPKIALGPAERASLYGLINVAARSGAGPDFVPAAAWRLMRNRSVSEFDREKVHTALVAEIARDAPAPNADLILSGSIRLGQYDRGGFPIIDAPMAYDRPANVSADNFITSQISNPEALLRLPASEALGRDLVSLTTGTDRRLPALFRVRVTDVSRTNTTSGVEAKLTLELQEFTVVHPRDPRRGLVTVPAANVSEGVPATTPPDRVALASTPTRVLLNQDSLTLMMLKTGLLTSDDTLLKGLMAQRWKEENPGYDQGPSAPPLSWGRFFPAGYRALTDADIERFLPSFRRWNELRVAALPPRLTFRWTTGDGREGFGTHMGLSNLVERFGLAKQTSPSVIPTPIHLRQERDPNATGFIGTVFAFSRRGSASADDAEAVVNIPDMPGPRLTGYDVGGYEFFADLDIKSVSVETGGKGRALLLIDTEPREARWWSYKTAVVLRQLLARIPVAGGPTSFDWSTVAVKDTRPLVEKPAPGSGNAASAPVAPTLPAEPYDILGVKLGMDLAEAEKIVGETMEVGARLAVRSSVATLSVYRSGTVLVRKDKQEYVFLMTEPERSRTKVLAIGRYVYFGLGAFDKAEFAATLAKKYGAPTPVQDQFTHWVQSGRVSAGSACLGVLGTQADVAWKDDAGNVVDPRSMAFDSAPASFRGPASVPWLGLRVLDMSQLALYRPCGPTVTSWTGGVNARVDEFAIWLSDPKAYTDILTGPNAAPQAEQKTIPQLKL
ncbi:peptidoglycan-binding domain-containing protein [uncultured Alsobacter sp.]|uniref:peptidoglycan-binding domain-containing protein n=1 Tax=uncultured Alsobacter sp. TaxID=1748258 RepID=UPI0025DE0764|nr:peptidoglycan-binding domain-containing protein [uncultured Alsobacter sp.]